MAASNLLAVLVLLSLFSIVLFVVAGAAISLMTVARATRQLRQSTGDLGRLEGFAGNQDLIDIDASLERIMTEERGELAGRLPG